MKKLYKSIHDRKLSGVCGGIAEYLNVDATMVRLIVILLAVFTAGMPVIIGYIVAAVIIPYAPGYEPPRHNRPDDYDNHHRQQ